MSSCIVGEGISPRGTSSNQTMASSRSVAGAARLFDRLRQIGRTAWKSDGGYRFACFFIACVSVHDAALIVVNSDVIGEVERNPLGRWLLEVQNGDVWLFVLVKLAATATVWSALLSLRDVAPCSATLVASTIAAFQFGLLCYLTFA